jgi:hypothetical protein
VRELVPGVGLQQLAPADLGDSVHLMMPPTVTISIAATVAVLVTWEALSLSPPAPAETRPATPDPRFFDPHDCAGGIPPPSPRLRWIAHHAPPLLRRWRSHPRRMTPVSAGRAWTRF